MNDSVKALLASLLGGLVRHGLTSLGTVVGFQGVATDSNVNALTGAGLILVGLAWSAVQKYMAQKEKPSV